jgi:serine/threonine-protein kinase HipA
MTDAKRHEVWLGNRLAGRLTAEANNLHFEYDVDYRDSSDATPLSMSLPLTRDQHASSAVTGFFEALLPEQGPARARLELEAGVSRSNVLGLLTYVGRDLPGAISVIPEGDDIPTDGGVAPLTEGELAERLADLRRSAGSGGVPLSEHGQWSLAGAQAKLALAYSDGQWGVPYGSIPTTHILKPAIPGFEQFDAFEVTCLRAARQLGLSSAQAWLQPLSDGTHAAVVVRYDRVVEPDGSILRIHQEDLCQALAYPAWQKYERDGGPGLSRIGALIKRLPATTRQETSTRLLDALAFNYAIAGTDGHARNFSLLLSGPDVVLAPLYDLNSALPYTRPWGKRFDSVRKLHSSFLLGSTDAFTRVGAADWRTLGDHVGLDVDVALERVAWFVKQVPDALVAASRQVVLESGLEVAFDWEAALAGYREACRF